MARDVSIYRMLLINLIKTDSRQSSKNIWLWLWLRYLAEIKMASGNSNDKARLTELSPTIMNRPNMAQPLISELNKAPPNKANLVNPVM